MSRSRSKSEDSRKQGDFGYLFNRKQRRAPTTGIGHFTPVEVPKNVPYRHWKPLETPKESPKSRGRKKVKAADKFLRANLWRENIGVVGGKKTRRKKTRGKKKRHRRTKKY